MRVAGFFAQGGHESGDFNTLKENLNYSWPQLRKVFGRYFPTDASAKAAERKPEVIANIVYNDANRKSKMGNTQPGDGWRFIGRGIFQLTGRTNYTNFGKSVGMTAEEVAAYCETKKGALESACWYWKINNLNAFADKGDIRGMSVRVNGGENGMADRVLRWNNAKAALAAGGLQKTQVVSKPKLDDVLIVPTVDYRQLDIGSKGSDVKEVQKFLKLSADGIFGPATKKAVQSWQRANGEKDTGIITEAQQEKMFK